ncbi:metallohydrolase [Vulcanibacillus modesticaldus]|uniref:Metallohydrolase n=1 Tax=Vulcanibacillus modesticaldus TaxID=337097 RepID=A0A1D2YVK6_9BACI|nr:MBL fold metallo-hydrolase [Vulcanibacillus modesticaldus]OEF99687.1 metallohydrolase [Vulcanibacillus modesticaldus]
MKYSILASGSTGNSIYIGTDEYNLLIDAGLSGKKIEMGLEKIGVSPKDIDGILITHEHDDHVKGIGVLARRYQIPIYANAKTFENLPSQIGEIDDSLKRILETGTVKEFGKLQVESFAISHDAAEPVGYVLRKENLKLSVVTDLGYVSQKIKDKIIGSDAYIFEANHDVQMLRMSSYPWSVKQRILSDVGHLSNEASGEALAEIITEVTQKVHLAHLSKENNLIELARLTVKNILEDYGITEEDVKLLDTFPDRPTSLEILDRKKVKFKEILAVK